MQIVVGRKLKKSLDRRTIPAGEGRKIRIDLFNPIFTLYEDNDPCRVGHLWNIRNKFWQKHITISILKEEKIKLLNFKESGEEKKKYLISKFKVLEILMYKDNIKKFETRLANNSFTENDITEIFDKSEKIHFAENYTEKNYHFGLIVNYKNDFNKSLSTIAPGTSREPKCKKERFYKEAEESYFLYFLSTTYERSCIQSYYNEHLFDYPARNWYKITDEIVEKYLHILTSGLNESSILKIKEILNSIMKTIFSIEMFKERLSHKCIFIKQITIENFLNKAIRIYTINPDKISKLEEEYKKWEGDWGC